MKGALLAASFVSLCCAAKIPLDEHNTLMKKQAADYEDRLRRADDDSARAAKTAAQEKEELTQSKKALEERVAQLESALGDKQRTLDDVTQQLLELQEAFNNRSSKDRTKTESELSKEKALKAALGELEAKFKKALEAELAEAKVEVSATQDQVSIRFKDGALFAKGSSRLIATSKAMLDRFAEALKASAETTVRIEAHTDSVRPKEGDAGDTWSLTQQQGLAVAQALRKAGVDPTRLACVSFGQFRPIATNDTPEGRAQNRRVEIVLAGLRAR